MVLEGVSLCNRVTSGALHVWRDRRKVPTYAHTPLPFPELFVLAELWVFIIP